VEKQTKSFFLLPFLFSIVLIIGMFLGFKLSKSFTSKSTHSNANLNELVDLIEREYVDSIDVEMLNKNGIEGILKTLDPHTVYIPKQELTRANEQLSGSFFGIGVSFFSFQDTMYISSIISDGPSENKGLFPGDKIIQVDTNIISGKMLSDEEIIHKIRGEKDKSLKLKVLHLNNKLEEVTIKRGIVPIKSVQAYFKINDTTGYISIKVFSETTYTEFKNALSYLVNQKISHLIIDVRDNPGGYMNAVAQIADELIPGTHTLISTIGKNNKDSIISNVEGEFEQGKVTILINEYAASASEILAGIVQDLDRGTVIGRRSYGKGLVQEQFELPDHSAIRITVARYFLPSGRCIQKSYVDGKEKYDEDIESRFKQGKLTAFDTIKNNAKKKYYSLKKREVFANQGISPDIFVRLDTSYNHKLIYFYTQHIAELYTQKYFYFNKTDFNRYKSVQQFHNEFKLTDKMYFELLKLMKANKIDAKIIDDQKANALILSSLKTEFSKLIFNINGKFFEESFDDKMIEASLK
jgi:carboxyl-terminal processing protease